MQKPFFFGYGSLVNGRTHDYPDLTIARMKGWRRAWLPSPLRPVAFLSAVPDHGSAINGVIAHVPNSDWQALDLREKAYDRVFVAPDTITHSVANAEVQTYAVRDPYELKGTYPILLSYLDVVIQGYLHHFGLAGARHFVETTDGWDTPVRDDRAAPEYPRHQTLSPEETAIVDELLAGLSAVME